MTKAPAKSLVRRVIGVMSGTSIDGIDAALVRLDGSGLSIQATLLRHAAIPLGELAQPLRDAAEQKPMPAGEFARLAWNFGCLHIKLIESLIESNRALDLIAIHGQTVFHQPPVTWQLLNPAPIAQRFGCPIVCDFRQADLAAGGQGAPITPIADWIMFRDQHKSRTVVNLGGFCNITILPAGNSTSDLASINGADICPCNHVLDAVARLALKQAMDVDGAAAESGMADPDAVNTLVSWMNRRSAPSAQRSMGTGDEAAEWVRHHFGRLSAQDLAASAANAIGSYIALALRSKRADEVILAGGGARNRALVAAIRSISKRPVRLSNDLGVPIEARESMAMAVLGALSADGVAITLPQVTGCSQPAPVAGVWLLPTGGSSFAGRT
ncbi:MAG: anhydro-N-acetylmuramic acid kinase [Phycisphaerales bacterium]|nr:anhydro-N-acetylmuramic acid kinase [Phycisphaerales bacterium]